MLKEYTESEGQSTVFYSSDAASPNKPELNITYSGEGNYYGSRPYQYASEYSCNPVGFALEYNPSPDNYNLGLSNSLMVGKTQEQITSIVVQKLSDWMTNTFGANHYGTITTYNSVIDTGWFRVVVRVGLYEDTMEDGIFQTGEEWDYSLWYQTNENDGQWAYKLDLQPSQLVSGSSGSTNPTAFINQWLVHGMMGTIVCDGLPRYFKIHDIRSNQW